MLSRTAIHLIDSLPVTPAEGGTGITSYAIGDLLQASASTTLAKLAAVATGNVLISGGVTTVSSWGKVGLTTHVSGTLPATNGGTGVSNAGTITNANNTTITGGGTLALAGFTITVPATGTAALLATENVFSVKQVISGGSAPTTSATSVGIGAGQVRCGDAFYIDNGTVVVYSVLGGTTGYFGTQTNHTFVVRTNNADRISVLGGGEVDFAAACDITVNNTTASTGLGVGAIKCAGAAAFTKELIAGLGLWLVDGITAPSSTSGYGKIFIDSADGDLKIIYGDGTTKTIVTDT